MVLGCNCIQDFFVFVEFYNVIDGLNWIISWDLIMLISSWFGVFLNVEGCVICLDLDGIEDCDNFSFVFSGNSLSGLFFDLNFFYLQIFFCVNNNILG